jgi:hypothetical protein
MTSSDNVLEIPVTYKGEKRTFPAIFMQSGYIHKIQVEVDGQRIMFEPDEEGNYRVLLDASQLEKNINPDIALLEAIAAVLESVVQ